VLWSLGDMAQARRVLASLAAQMNDAIAPTMEVADDPVKVRKRCEVRD